MGSSALNVSAFPLYDLRQQQTCCNTANPKSTEPGANDVSVFGLRCNGLGLTSKIENDFSCTGVHVAARL